MSDPKPVNLLDHITAGRELPAGYDSWAIRSVHPDLTSSRGFRWPFPGKVAKAAGPCHRSDNPCPSTEGDGICAAHTWHSMASGGIPAITLLLVAYRTADVLADSTDKVRVSKARVVEVVDGARLLRAHGTGADLYGANLTRADLTGADLYGADLTGAIGYKVSA